MRILLKLPVIRAGKKRRRKEKSRTIEKKDKSRKRLLITSIKIWSVKSMTCFFGTMQDNWAKITTETLLLKSLIKFALILLVVVMIKSISGQLLCPVFALLSAWPSDLLFISVFLPISTANRSSLTPDLWSPIANLSSIPTDLLFPTSFQFENPTQHLFYFERP